MTMNRSFYLSITQINTYYSSLGLVFLFFFNRGGNPFATVRLRPTVTNDRSAPIIWPVHISTHPANPASTLLRHGLQHTAWWMAPGQTGPVLRRRKLHLNVGYPYCCRLSYLSILGPFCFTELMLIYLRYIYKYIYICIFFPCLFLSPWLWWWYWNNHILTCTWLMDE